MAKIPANPLSSKAKNRALKFKIRKSTELAFVARRLRILALLHENPALWKSATAPLALSEEESDVAEKYSRTVQCNATDSILNSMFFRLVEFVPDWEVLAPVELKSNDAYMKKLRARDLKFREEREILELADKKKIKNENNKKRKKKKTLLNAIENYH